MRQNVKKMLCCVYPMEYIQKNLSKCIQIVAIIVKLIFATAQWQLETRGLNGPPQAK